MPILADKDDMHSKFIDGSVFLMVTTFHNSTVNEYNEISLTAKAVLQTVKFKLKPNSQQSTRAYAWRPMVRGFLNVCLADRIGTYSETFAQGPFCSLRTKAEACPLSCSVSRSASVGNPWKGERIARKASKKVKKGQVLPPSKRSTFEMHSSYLTAMKRERPWYKDVNADVLQQALKHQDSAFSKFFSGLAKFPRFKQTTDVKGFEFKPKTVRFDEKSCKVLVPSLGWMGYFKSRTLGDDCQVKKSHLMFEADGLYLVALIDYPNVLDCPKKELSELCSVNGLDRGIKKIVAGADGEVVTNPLIFKQHERRLKIRQRRLSRKKKGSANRAKAGKRVARVHQRIKRVREDFQWKLAKKEAAKADVIGLEDLNIKGMMRRCKPKKNENGQYERNGQAAKSGLSKAIADASWYSLELKLKHQASKLGNWIVSVPARFTSQECSSCGYTSPSNRDKEKFVCESCGHHDDADVDAGVVIAKRARSIIGLPNLSVVSRKVTPLPESTGTRKRELSLVVADEPRNLKQQIAGPPVQMSLLDLIVSECGESPQKSPAIAQGA